MALLDLHPQIEKLERDLGIDEDVLARALDVNVRTVARWHGEGRIPRGETRRRFDELLELRDQLVAMFPSREVIHEWMNSPSLYLGGFTPTDALKLGAIHRARADLNALAAGIYL
ncbi:MAG: hypothetical protein M3Z66_16080 [Chloroflexota bacterium]|nr:hypothetical protein [Chloroflexota bacterium]